MPKKIFETLKHCDICNTDTPVGLIQNDKVVCLICSTELKSKTMLSINLDFLRRKLQAMLPMYWFSNTHINPMWDKNINDYLDNTETIFEVNRHTTLIDGKIEIWTSNYPYAYGSFYGYKGFHLPKSLGHSGLPLRSTRIRLYEHIEMIRKLKDVE